MDQSPTTVPTIRRILDHLAMPKTFFGAALLLATPVLLTFSSTPTTAQGGGEEWVCADTVSEDHHYDDVVWGVVVEYPDGQHVSKGEEMCLEVHTPHMS